MMLKLILMSASFIIVFSEQTRKGDPRKAKFLNFQTVDEDIKVSLEFTVPFLTIPVKKSVEAFGFSDLSLPSININLASLALAATVVFGTSVIIPFLLKSTALHSPNYRYAKLIDQTQFGADGVLEFASKVLSDKGSLHGCALRVACWAAQTPTFDSRRILQKVMQNKVLSTMVNSTAIESALTSGRRGQDCAAYEPCPLQPQHAPVILSNIAALLDTSI